MIGRRVGRSRRARLFAAALAWGLPALLTGAIYSARWSLPPDRAPLGFVHVDQVVYYAAARELFENGNGLFYASPFSNRPDSPRIYSHLGFLLVGWAWRLSGLSWETIDLAFRFVFGVAALGLALAIFRQAPTGRRWRRWSALALSAGGGAAAWTALARHLVDFALNRAGGDFPVPLGEWMLGWPEAFRQAEGGYGEWHLNLFRSLTLMPQPIYHVLFLGTALALARGRAGWAPMGVFLAWWAHPFTGLELGLVAMAFLIVETAMVRRRGPGIAAAGVAAVNVLFLTYYLAFLPRFEEHAATQARIADFGNPLLTRMLWPAYGLWVALPAAYLLSARFRRDWRRRRAVRLMTVWLVVVAALVFHDRWARFMKPVQPMHFTRGYLFIPLVYFSVCGLDRLLSRLRRRRRPWAWVIAAMILLLQLPDNFVRLALFREDLARRVPVYSIPRPALRMFEALDTVEERLTLHAIGLQGDFAELERLLPVLTPHRPLLGHPFNTPFIEEKTQAAAGFFEEPSLDRLRQLRLTALAGSPEALRRLQDRLPDVRFEPLVESDRAAVARLSY